MKHTLKFTVQQAEWDSSVKHAFRCRYEAWPRALAYYTALWTDHFQDGLADPEIVASLIGADDCARRQRIWEMQLAAHLRACGHVPGRRPKGQPDYRIETGGGVVWVEAVSPAPGNNPPAGWLQEPAYGQVTTAPFDWVLSRWTSALKEKHRKGADYEKRGIVGTGDAYVVAIDGGQLSRYTMSHGASGLPLGLEATFPVGPRAFRFGEDGRLHGMENLLRFAIKNHNGANIPTERFLDEEFSNVSAVVGCWPPMFSGPELPVHVVHNPLARVKMPSGTFGGSTEEWHAVEVKEGDELFWQVERIR